MGDDPEKFESAFNWAYAIEFVKVAATPALYQRTLSPFESSSAFFSTAAVPGKAILLIIGMAEASINLGINALSSLLRGEFAVSFVNSCMALFCFAAATITLKFIIEPLLILTAASLATRSIATGISYLCGSNEAEVEPDAQLQLP